jgi:glutaredoxin
MKELTYFYMKLCPYCRQADQWLNELRQENSKFAEIPIKRVEETREKELADSYPYYYVPSFFIGREKLHEGAATKEKIKAVLERALED